MSRHKIKPDLDLEKNQEELIQAVAEYYGEPYDDRRGQAYDHVSLRAISKKFKISTMKARKMLITAGIYSIAQSRLVQELHSQGLSQEEISERTGLSRASITSYLPYSKRVYNMKEKSVNADRVERWRNRHQSEMQPELEDMSYWIWIVEWKSKGDYVREQFNTQEEAQNFVEYTEWQRGEHPTIKEIEFDGE